MGSSERQRELRRRRHRKKKLQHYKSRLPKASTSEKAVIVKKIRQLSPGCDQILENLGLVEQ